MMTIGRIFGVLTLGLVVALAGGSPASAQDVEADAVVVVSPGVVTEPSGGSTSIVFKVIANPSGGDELTVTVATTDLEMQPGEDYPFAVAGPNTDYEPKSEEFVFDSLSEMSFEVDVLADDLPEGPELLVVDVTATSNDGHAIAVPNSAAVISANDAGEVEVDTVSISGPSGLVDEGDPATFTVSSPDAEPGDVVTVEVSTADVALGDSDLPAAVAGPNNDYTPLDAATVTLDDTNSFTDTIDVTTTDDNDPEGPEALAVTATNATTTDGAASVVQPAAVAVIGPSDTDTDAVTITGPTGPVAEGDPATFTVTSPDAEPGDTIDVDLATLDGTATTTDGDYTALPTDTTLTLDDTNGFTDTIDIDTLDDPDPEAPETFHVEITDITGDATLHPDNRQAAAVISANDTDADVVTVTGPTGPVDEGDPATFTVTGRNLDAPATVTLESRDGGAGAASATAGDDYTPLADPTTVTLDDANGFEDTVEVETIDDADTETPEAFEVVISDVDGPSATAVDNSPAQAVIEDDDADVDAVTIEGPTEPVPEPGEAVFTVSLVDGEAGDSYTVDVATAPGEVGMLAVPGFATEGTDYAATSGPVVVDSDNPTAEVVVPVLDDTDTETPELVRARITNVTGNNSTAHVEQAEGLAVIEANDTDTDAVTITGPTGPVAEGDPATFTVTSPDAEPGDTIDVDLATLDGTATTTDGDYTALPTDTTLTLDDTNGFTDTIDIDTLDDPDPEAPETFHVEITDITGDATLHPDNRQAAAVISANDTDADVVTVTGPTGPVDEGDPATFTVTGRNLDAPATVTLESRDGGAGAASATAGDDYTPLADPTTVTLDDANGFEDTVEVETIDDADTETPEAFEVVISDVDGPSATAVDNSPAQAVIEDDDADVDAVTIEGPTEPVPEPGEAVFTVSLVDGEAGDSYTVDVATAPGEVGMLAVPGFATEGTDYAATSGPVVVDSDNPTAEVVVPVLDDTDTETPELVRARITNVTGNNSTAHVEQAEGLAVIEANDTDDVDRLVEQIQGLTTFVTGLEVDSIDNLEHAPVDNVFDRDEVNVRAVVKGQFLSPDLPLIGDDGTPPRVDVVGVGSGPVSGEDVAVDVGIYNSDQIAVDVSVPADVERGTFDVKVTQTNGLGQPVEGVCPGCLEIPNPPATAAPDDITQGVIDNDDTDAGFTLHGTDLLGAALTSVELTKGDETLTTDVDLVNSTPSTLEVDIAGSVKDGAAAGDWTVTLTSDANTVVAGDTLLINTPAPDITGITNDDGTALPDGDGDGTPDVVQGQSYTLKLTGSFDDSAAVSTDLTGVSLSGETVQPNAITFTATVADGATLAEGTVTVTHGDQRTDATPLEVVARPTLQAPSDPPSFAQGAERRTLDLPGTDLHPDVSVNIPAAEGGTIEKLSVTSTDLKLRFTVDPDAAVGDAEVTVTNPNGGTDRCEACFSVTEGPKIVEVVDPDTGTEPEASPGAVGVTFEIVGTNFDQLDLGNPTSPGVSNPRVEVEGEVEVVRVTRLAPRPGADPGDLYDVLEVEVDVAGSATGDLDVTVTNRDRGRSVAEDAFHII